jgi:23S rRNA (uracil1939-C5)-methyltransferase
VSTFSFFQTNTAGAELLYDVVRDFCELTGRETVLDAYCGTGTIGIYVASQAERVVGIELVRDAVWDARYNARENGADNCTFFAGDMREVMPSIPKTMGVRFDRVIVDPPRGGMEKRALRQLIDLKAPLMVYVSCNPATLARDLVQLAEAGYNVEAVQPVDMFPHTWHVESVLKLRLGEKPNASTQSHEDTKKS